MMSPKRVSDVIIRENLRGGKAMSKRNLAIGIAVATVGVLALTPQMIKVGKRWRRRPA